jgi:hypothetical protein
MSVTRGDDRRRQCDGWVTRLRGQIVAYTGRVLIVRCAEWAARRGADWRDDWTSEVTLLVHGDLAGKRVIDPDRGYSRKLVSAQQSRRQGRPCPCSGR